MGSKATFYETLMQTMGLEVITCAVGFFIRLHKACERILWRNGHRDCPQMECLRCCGAGTLSGNVLSPHIIRKSHEDLNLLVTEEHY
jgi:hypothetical protein